MKTNLTQSITIHSAYGVEVEYTDGEIFTVDSKIERYNEPLKKVSVFRAIHDIEQGKAKLLLHSLDKLTQEIDGKVGIVELFQYPKCNYNVYQEIDNYCVKFDFEGDFIIEKIPKDLTTITLWQFNYLLANHYNVLGLSSEYFKEKSI